LPSLLPPYEDATPEGELNELRSNVQCAPLKSGFVVCVANLISEQLLPRRALDHGQHGATARHTVSTDRDHSGCIVWMICALQAIVLLPCC